MSYVVEITDSTTGQTREWKEQGEWDYGTEYLWSDGNYGCDCNRSLWFARAAGSDGLDVEMECGNSRFTIAVKVDGEIVYDE